MYDNSSVFTYFRHIIYAKSYLNGNGILYQFKILKTVIYFVLDVIFSPVHRHSFRNFTPYGNKKNFLFSFVFFLSYHKQLALFILIFLCQKYFYNRRYRPTINTFTLNFLLQFSYKAVLGIFYGKSIRHMKQL